MKISGFVFRILFLKEQKIQNAISCCILSNQYVGHDHYFVWFNIFNLAGSGSSRPEKTTNGIGFNVFAEFKKKDYPTTSGAYTVIIQIFCNEIYIINPIHIYSVDHRDNRCPHMPKEYVPVYMSKLETSFKTDSSSNNDISSGIKYGAAIDYRY